MRNSQRIKWGTVRSAVLIFNNGGIMDMKKAVVFLADGMEECEGLITVDILRRSGMEVTMASIMGRRSITSSRNIVILADALAEEIDYQEVDLIVLPGGRIGTENLMADELVRRKCLEFAGERRLAAICAAPSILADLGLLEGRKATCHPDFEGKTRGAKLTGNSVTVDGNITTGQGLGATFAFALSLVTDLVGKEAADRIAASICLK